jgi:hypothetical protein
VREREATERVGEAIAEPDEMLVFVGIDIAIGSRLACLRPKCLDREAKPRDERIEW